MIYLKKYKNHILLLISALFLLIFSFYGCDNTVTTPDKNDYDTHFGSDAEVLSDSYPIPSDADLISASDANEQKGNLHPEETSLSDASVGASVITDDNPKQASNPSVQQTTPIGSKDEKSEKINNTTGDSPAVFPSDIQTKNATGETNENDDNKEYTCTLSVRCDTILENMHLLDSQKHTLVPPDGIIYENKNVVFYENESVFNVLLREMKKNKIHLEFVNVPLYNSAYIEGIANLYEFDCGELSGWKYSVNGIFPEIGCSQYKLNDGDRVEWNYSINSDLSVSLNSNR
ncbi:MAG: DUF4430 domain-containing protein [Clostridia bacterium]|nr:DUF4430 domain-containing protein [Clostridia bacterium]